MSALGQILASKHLPDIAFDLPRPAVMEDLTHLLDFVLDVTVNPGLPGQRLCGSGIAKIAGCKKWLSDVRLAIPIEIDGNASFENLPKMVEAGADFLFPARAASSARPETYATMPAESGMPLLRVCADKNLLRSLSPAWFQRCNPMMRIGHSVSALFPPSKHARSAAPHAVSPAAKWLRSRISLDRGPAA